MQYLRSLNKGYIDALFVILIWSGFILISRMGGKSELLPYDVVALRFGTAALLLLPVWLLHNKVNLLQPKILTLGLTGGLGYSVTVYIGFKYAPATHAAIMLPGLLPFEIAVFSWLLLGESPSARRLMGLAGIALGVLCLIMETFSTGLGAWKGDLAFVFASTSWALYTVLVRRWKISVWDATIGSALVSAGVYLPVYWLTLPTHISVASWEMIGVQAFYQGVMAVIVAMVLYMRAVNALGPSRLGVCMALVPVVSGLAAVPLMNESLPLLVIAGLGFTSAGAWLGSRG